MEKYEVLEQIGEGSFGEVFLVSSRKTGKKFVMKKIDLKVISKDLKIKCHNEVQFLRNLYHPLIVTYFESFLSEEKFLCLILELAEQGNLKDFLNKGSLEEK